MLKDNGFILQWQFRDHMGWKTMIPEANTRLTEALDTEDFEVEILHKWISPKSGTNQQTTYTVNMRTMTQVSHESHRNERDVRLVACRPVLSSD